MSQQVIKVTATSPANSVESHYILVEKRSEFALEVLSLVEQGLTVELKAVEDGDQNPQCLKTCEMEKQYGRMLKPKEASYF